MILTIEDFETEYNRIAKLLKKKAITGDQYRLNCKDGYSPYLVKRDIGLTYNKAKLAIGAPLVTTANNGGVKIPRGKIYCQRGEGAMITRNQCVPNCNDDCKDCKSMIEKNVHASDTYTVEEEKIIRHSAGFGGGMGKMIEETIVY